MTEQKAGPGIQLQPQEQRGGREQLGSNLCRPAAPGDHWRIWNIAYKAVLT